jgi:quercetin dioxygenase-like cupin family protein
MKIVRRQFLQVAGAVVAVSGTCQSTWAQNPAIRPDVNELLRGDLEGQSQRVQETVVTVVAFPPGAISTWHVHPGAQELVFGLQGNLTLEIEGLGVKSINAGETGIIPANIPHTVRNHATAEPAKILVVYSRSDKSKPLRVDVNKG